MAVQLSAQGRELRAKPPTNSSLLVQPPLSPEPSTHLLYCTLIQSTCLSALVYQSPFLQYGMLVVMGLNDISDVHWCILFPRFLFVKRALFPRHRCATYPERSSLRLTEALRPRINRAWPQGLEATETRIGVKCNHFYIRQHRIAPYEAIVEVVVYMSPIVIKTNSTQLVRLSEEIQTNIIGMYGRSVCVRRIK